MNATAWFAVGCQVVETLAGRRSSPLVGSIILTDRCNLACLHCAVANIRKVDYPLPRVRADLANLRAQGVRVLFLYGGEPFLWHDGDFSLRDLVIEARRLGFVWIGVVTNGTRGVDLPQADRILVSLDGCREHHNQIRGNNYDRVLAGITASTTANIVLYMAVNRINQDDIEQVCHLAARLPTVRAVSFNLHTPYPGTEDLTLTRQERRDCCQRIEALIDRGLPVMNLKAALPFVAENTFAAPCRQCVVVEDGRQWVCGRCADVPGLCAQCGFLFAAELSLLFAGNRAVLRDAIGTYGRYLLPGGGR